MINKQIKQTEKFKIHMKDYRDIREVEFIEPTGKKSDGYLIHWGNCIDNYGKVYTKAVIERIDGKVFTIVPDNINFKQTISQMKKRTLKDWLFDNRKVLKYAIAILLVVIFFSSCDQRLHRNSEVIVRYSNGVTENGQGIKHFKYTYDIGQHHGKDITSTSDSVWRSFPASSDESIRILFETESKSEIHLLITLQGDTICNKRGYKIIGYDLIVP